MTLSVTLPADSSTRKKSTSLRGASPAVESVQFATPVVAPLPIPPTIALDVRMSESEGGNAGMYAALMGKQVWVLPGFRCADCVQSPPCELAHTDKVFCAVRPVTAKVNVVWPEQSAALITSGLALFGWFAPE